MSAKSLCHHIFNKIETFMKHIYKHETNVVYNSQFHYKKPTVKTGKNQTRSMSFLARCRHTARHAPT